MTGFTWNRLAAAARLTPAGGLVAAIDDGTLVVRAGAITEREQTRLQGAIEDHLERLGYDWRELLVDELLAALSQPPEDLEDLLDLHDSGRTGAEWASYCDRRRRRAAYDQGSRETNAAALRATSACARRPRRRGAGRPAGRPQQRTRAGPGSDPDLADSEPPGPLWLLATEQFGRVSAGLLRLLLAVKRGRER